MYVLSISSVSEVLMVHSYLICLLHTHIHMLHKQQNRIYPSTKHAGKHKLTHSDQNVIHWSSQWSYHLQTSYSPTWMVEHPRHNNTHHTYNRYTNTNTNQHTNCIWLYVYTNYNPKPEHTNYYDYIINIYVLCQCCVADHYDEDHMQLIFCQPDL